MKTDSNTTKSPNTSNQYQKLNQGIYPTALILAIACAYYSAIGFPYIGYDNNLFIIENPLLGNWSISNLIQIWKPGGVLDENLYIPLTYTTYFIETAIAGVKPFLIHLDNLLLHILKKALHNI